jgi:hypothetical protein
LGIPARSPQGWLTSLLAEGGLFMSDENFEDILKRAAKMSEVVPEHLREAAFNRAFDALVAGRQTGLSKKRTEKPRKSKSTKRDQDSTKKRGSGGRPGPRSALNQLVSEGYFDSVRRMGDIQSHLSHSKALTYKTSDLSPTLIRMLRDDVLTRTRASDGQYEYKRK